MQGVMRIVVFCSDMERSRCFYSDAGFTMVEMQGGMCTFDAGGGTEVLLHPAGEGRARVPCDLALHVRVQDVDDLFVRVREHGLIPFDHDQPGVELRQPVRRPWGDREFELADPDGYRWAFTSPAANV
ncbi:MAG: VOC family protein [Firmicutes bacterium]|nr:VOC family protein [Bacillota bacterium]